MALDRPAALRNAETLVGDGQFDQAIEEYVRILDQEPDDPHVAMLLGDLYVRTGRIEEGIAQLAALARRFRRQGFLAKAAATYKKILKAAPEDDRAWIELADITAAQGQLVDARRHLTAVGERRRGVGDHAGVAEIASLIAALPAKWAEASAAEAAGRPEALAAAVLARAEAPASPASAELSRPGVASAAEAVRVMRPSDDAPSTGASIVAPASAREPERGPIDDVFAGLRRDASERLAIDRSEQEFRRGLALHAAGQLDECLAPLAEAARSPRRQAEAASVVASVYRARGDAPHALEWYERAADAAAPTRDAALRLLYELADALEWAGERARALAVFIDLQADAGDYADVAARIAWLAETQERG